MSQFENTYYPSGKPLCIYEEGKQIYYTYEPHKIFAHISFMDKGGRYTGEAELYENGALYEKRSFNDDTKKTGLVETFDKTGKLIPEKTAHFLIDANGQKETTTYASGSVLIQTRDGNTNAVITKSFFGKDSNNKPISWKMYQNNNLPDGPLVCKRDYKNVFTQTFKHGKPIHLKGYIIKRECTWQDASTGTCTVTMQDSEGRPSKKYQFENFAITELSHFDDGNLHAYEQWNEGKLKSKYDYKNGILINEFKARSWNVHNNIQSASVREFNENGILVKVSDKASFDHAMINTAVSISRTKDDLNFGEVCLFQENGKVVDRASNCRIRYVERLGVLAAYSLLTDKPKPV